MSVVYKNINMPNRKIGSMPAKITPQRSKGRQKKDKPVLKTPTVLKIKIPPVKSLSPKTENQKAVQPKMTKNDIKVMLANEVIRAQFPKKLTVTKESIKKIQNDKPNKRGINKNTILNRKHVLRSSITVSEDNKIEECINKEPVKRKQHKILKTEINSKLTDNEPSEDLIENIVVSPKTVKKSPKPVRLRRKTPGPSIDPLETAKVTPEKETPTKPKTIAKRKSINTKPGPITRRSKAIKEVKEEISTNIHEEKDVSIDKKELTSRRSSISELSWTKDISSSSTTTCITVSSNDFFRFDKKLPLVKLSNMDCERKYSDMCVSDSVGDKNSEMEVNCDSVKDISPLNLSASSISTLIESPKKITKLSETLNKLSSKLKNFDLEVVNWIGETDQNSEIDILNNKMIQDGFLKEEKDIIFTCKEINRILSNDTEIDVNKDVDNEEIKRVVSTETNKELNVNKQSVEDNDDDDALSLFAESITGIESSRRNSSYTGAVELTEVEEYVPEPVYKDTFKSPEITYKPSRIPTTERSDQDNVNANFCEKQNADSTSVYKENSNNFIYEDRIGDMKNSSQLTHSSPRLMASIHKPRQGIHSYIFRGVCFFYLISGCKKSICKFPHSFIEIEEVKAKLSLISEHLFIEEYMLVRAWPQLRRKYGKCFVEECVNRELSRFAVEMAIDFIIKSTEKSRDDNILKIEIVETVLLYLNRVDLNACADLLNYNVQNFTGALLCDFFMKTIAESQNFSQFRAVFINLTEFMCKIRRTFDMNVATLILERVSILPYDEGLARGLIEIIKNTDGILSNPMIGNFEMRLLSSNPGLYNELMGLQEKTRIAKMPTESIQINNNLIQNRYSPDTTNLDNMKSIEPIITRTIDFKKIQPHLNNKMQKSIMNGSKNYNNWMNKTIFDNIRFNQSQTKWQNKRRSERNLETRPSKYQRRDGPSFSQDFL